jgi:hypothetical protein
MTYPDDRQAVPRLRDLGESIGIRIDNPTLVGIQGNTLGIRSQTALWSARTDSRTYFQQDQDFGISRRRGHFDGSADELLEAAQPILDRLGIPSEERINTRVITEQTRAARFDPDTNSVDLEPSEDGIRYAETTRAIEAIPIWHSKALIALAADGTPGFLHVHWPELPNEVIGEAARFAEAIRADWTPPPVQAAVAESSEAGVLHSLAVGFIMEAVAAVRVVYTADDARVGRKPVRYVTAAGEDVRQPREHLWDLDAVRTPARRA